MTKKCGVDAATVWYVIGIKSTQVTFIALIGYLRVDTQLIFDNLSLIEHDKRTLSYHKISTDNGSKEEWDADFGSHDHAVPHRFDPLSTKYTEDNHETVHEINKVPTRQFLGRKTVRVI